MKPYSLQPKGSSSQRIFTLFSIVLMLSLSFTNSGYAQSSGCDLNNFVTYTQGGWGSSHGTPATIRDSNFDIVFSSGLIVGEGTKTIKLTGAQKVDNFLPQSGTPGVLDGSYVNPSSTPAGSFGGQVVALKLNIGFSDASVLGTNGAKLGILIVKSGPFAGKSVYDMLDIANKTLAGVSTGFTLSQVNEAVTKINENFDGGTIDNHYLACPLIPHSVTIGDRVWLDDGDGIQEHGEPGVPNVVVKLYDCNDHYISETKTNSDGIYSFTNLTAGSYKVVVDLPSGYLFSPKDQGSDDQKDSDFNQVGWITDCFTLNPGETDLSVDAGIYLTPPPTCSIGDKVWNDQNKNGIQNSGEPGVGGITVELFACSTSTPIKTTTTDSYGNYLFTDVLAGNYTLKFSNLPYGYSFTQKDQGGNDLYDSDVEPSTGKTVCFNIDPSFCDSNSIKWDAGIYQHVPPPTCAIGDKVWNDLNKNGIQDASEPGVPNIKVELFACSTSTPLATTTTNYEGKYLFNSVSAGNYKLRFSELPSGWVFSPKDAGNDLVDSDVNPSTGETACFNIDPSFCDSNSIKWDAGIYQHSPSPTCSIGDRVWNDANKNGIQDALESGVPNIKVKLIACSTSALVDTKITDHSGNYLFEGVIAGNYRLKFEDLPSGWVFSPKDVGNDLFDSDVNPTNGETICFNIDPFNCDSNSTKWDAGIYQHVSPPTCSIGDRVWEDKNKDGIQDAGEPGVPNIKVKLFACSTSTPLAETITNHAGNYLFANVTAGYYIVKFENLPAGWSFSPKDVGNDLFDSDVDPNTGKTPCFNIDPSFCDSNSIKWDAGIFSYPPGYKVSGLVFNDANGNGDKDIGEVGIANVQMKLWGTSANLLATTLTDAHGKYEFLNVFDGQYHVQEIDLPGYVSTTPNSQFITVAGANISGILFGDKVVPVPEPCDLSKYVTMTQNSWKSVKGYNLLETKFTTLFPLPNGLIIGDNGASYQIKFTSVNAVKNFLPQTGVPYALDQSYINPVTTPAGEFAGHVLALALNVAYNEAGLLGSTSTTKLGNLVVGGGTLKDFKVYEVLNLANKALGGTITPFDIATLNDVVKKINENFDNCNLGYLVCPPPPDSCGGGFDAGVESNANLADLLLRRLTKIEYGQTTKILRNPKIAFTAGYGLNELFPKIGPMGSVSKETTPFDILGISNATSAYAVDYDLNLAKGNVRVASIFATTTNPPYIYEHTKAICDRLVNAELQHLSQIEVNGKYFFASVLYKQAENITDYTVHFSIYEKGGNFIVDSRWLIEDYEVPEGVTNVYNFQVWASNFNSTMYLVLSILEQFESRGTVEYLNQSALPISLLYVQKGKYSHNGSVELVINNNQLVVDNVTILVKSKAVQGGEKVSHSSTFTVQPGINTINLNSGIISDANIYISSTNGFKDEVFVSGGAYTYLNGSNSKVEEFVTNTFTTPSSADLPEESLILSGGAKVKGKLNDWVSLFRSLNANTAPYDLSDYDAIKVALRGYGNVWFRLEQDGITDFNYHAKQIRLDGSEQTFTIPFSEFKQISGTSSKLDSRLIRKISVYMDKSENSSLVNFEFEIKNIAFLSKSGSDKSKGESVPSEFKLNQNYPNPFNPNTLIEFSVAKSELVTIKVYNVLGKEVATLVNDVKEPGIHSVRFDANGLSSGIYLYKIQSESFTATKKMILQK